MIFKNNEIDISTLPKIEDGVFQQLDSNYLKVSYIGKAFFFTLLLSGLIIGYLLTDISNEPLLFFTILGLWFIWLIGSFILTKLGYAVRGYILRENDLIHRKGVIFKNLTTIPFNRVQHCEVSQGPIQRLFDLNTLEIFTAGGSNSDLSIPGLKGDTAQLIKDFIVKKTGGEMVEGDRLPIEEENIT